MFRLKTFAESRGHYIVFAIKEPSDENYPYLWKATTRVICYKVSQPFYTDLDCKTVVFFFPIRKAQSAISIILRPSKGGSLVALLHPSVYFCHLTSVGNCRCRFSVQIHVVVTTKICL